MKLIDTDSLSTNLRMKGIDIERKSVSITNFYNTKQEKDIKDMPNCNGFGRVRHFKYHVNELWPENPLPILPASKALGIDPDKEIRAQVFQNSICNWRCWYCFVDYKLLSGNPKYSNFKTCDELLDLYLKEDNPPKVIDFTGGQPDLTPEWVPWMMNTLIDRGLSDDIYLWSDDNLSNDYFWRFLSDKDIDLIKNYSMYGRVCCFKGIDKESFSLNTKASPELFDNQLELAGRLIDLKIDLYFYLTLTSSTHTNFSKVIPSFMDRLQSIHENLPLRIVPLEVFEFTPVISRLNKQNKDLIEGQYEAIKFWVRELNRRYGNDILKKPITEIKI